MCPNKNRETRSARWLNRRIFGPPISTRSTAAYESKSHIGRAVADLLSDDEVVFIDGGSTALAAAHALRGTGRRLTVLTRSLLIAAELAEEPHIEIFMLGGRVKSSEMLTTTSALSDDLRHFNVDTYVMGISGVHPTRGLTDYDPDESAGKRLALERADAGLARVFLDQCAQPSRIRIVKEMFFVSKHVVHLRTRGADLQAGGHEVYVNQMHSRFNEERKLGTLGQ